MSKNRPYGHVVFIGIDGMGKFNSQTDTPNMDRIFRDGAVSWSALSMDPTISAENWASMLIGVNPVVHGRTNSILDSREYTDKKNPTVFSRIRKTYPDSLLMSYCKWDLINKGIVEHGIGVETETGKDDAEVAEKVVKAISRKPDFMFVHFDDVDSAGHEFCFGESEYLEKITEADGYVGRIYDACVAAGIADDMLFIVTADHGGIRKGHGGYADTEKYVFLGICGKGIEKSSIGYSRTKDMAAIVLHAFGIKVPEYTEGGFTSQLPAGVFSGFGNDYYIVEQKPYEIERKETPAFDAPDGLSSFFAKTRIKLAMFMDDSLEDVSGKCGVKETGIVKYYSNGVMGSRGEFGKTGYVEIDGISFEKSFSIAAWIKIDRSIIESPAVCGNKDWWWRNRRKKGFMLSLRSSDTVFNIGNDDRDFDFITAFPEEISEGWVHTVISVDRENREIRCYYNFGLAHSAELPEKFLNGFVSELPFTLGNDPLGKYNGITHDFIFSLDDFIIFDGAFSSEDAENLARYYGITSRK